MFDFPSHLQKVISERRPLKRKVIEHDNDDTSPLTPSTSKSIKHSPTKEELKSIIQKQNKEIKTLKKKVKRKVEKICSLTGLIKDLNEKTLIDQKTVIKLNENL